MLNKMLDDYSVMGFATFSKRDGVENTDVIDASLNWSHQFLAPLEGVGFHCLLQNTKGGFADIVFAKNGEALSQLNENFDKSEASQKMMELLDPQSIQMTAMAISQDRFIPPTDFACIEIGFMKSQTASKEEILQQSKLLEDNYLHKFENTKSHFIGEVEQGSYTDVTFGRSLGETRKICLGFDQDKTATEFLSLFDPTSFQLDFWALIA